MKLTRSLLAATALSAAAALALTGCAGDSSSESADGKTILRVSVWNYDQTPEFAALFDAFEKKNPDVEIEPVDILAADYESKITTMLAGGDTTDIITVKNLTDYAEYASKGQLVDLSDAAADLDADSIPALAQYDWEGKTYALPYRQDFNVLYYNKTMLADAGLDDPTNLTWDDFADYAQKLTTGDGDSKVYGAYIHTWSSMVQEVAASQLGTSTLEPPYDWMTDQYELTLGMQDAGTILDYATATSQQTQYKDMFESGKAAMVPMGTWLISSLLADTASGATDVDWGIAPMPQIEATGEVTTSGGPTGFAVNKNAANADLAQEFAEFAVSEEGAKAVVSTGIVPALQSDAMTEAYFGLDGMPTDDLSQLAFAPDTINNATPADENTAKISTILNEEHQLIMTESTSIADGIAEMTERVDSEVLGK